MSLEEKLREVEERYKARDAANEAEFLELEKELKIACEKEVLARVKLKKHIAVLAKPFLIIGAIILIVLFLGLTEVGDALMIKIGNWTVIDWEKQ